MQINVNMKLCVLESFVASMCISLYLYIYVYIKVKSITFFGTQSFMLLVQHWLCKNLQPNELQWSNLLQYNCFFILNDITAQGTWKSSLFPWKVSIIIIVKTSVLYTSHKIYLLLKFIEIDEISVNLLHNYSKPDCHKFQKSQ